MSVYQLTAPVFETKVFVVFTKTFYILVLFYHNLIAFSTLRETLSGYSIAISFLFF